MNPFDYHAIFFDLGMVLVTFDWNIAIARFAARGCAPERVRTFLADPMHDVFERNEITAEEFFRRGQSITGFDGSLEEFKTYWNEIFSPLTPNVELARELAAFYPLFVISNTNPWHMDYIEDKFSWLEIFQQRFYSPMVGVRKPDTRIFEFALTRAGIAAPHALFLDDRLENVHGAQTVGMNAIHVPTPELATSELRKLVARARAQNPKTVQP
jgi:putative hydrolase of the HAD superfamily